MHRFRRLSEGYMALIRIAGVHPLPGLRLRLRLTNGSTIEREVDPLMVGPVFDPIRERPEMFARVTIDGGNGVVAERSRPVSRRCHLGWRPSVGPRRAAGVHALRACC